MIVMAALFLRTPMLHNQGRYYGDLYNLTVWLIYGGILVHLFGSNSGIHYFFLGGAAGAILIFNLSRNGVSVFSFLSQMLIFFYAEVYRIAPRDAYALPQNFEYTMFILNILFLLVFHYCLISYAVYLSKTAETSLTKECEYSNRLLENMMPPLISNALKSDPCKTIAKRHNDATIIFAKIAGFEHVYDTKTPKESVELLTRIFSEFDRIAQAHGLEKIKTDGAIFMAGAGFPLPMKEHAKNVALVALEMRDVVEKFATESDVDISLQCGVHSGPVVAGVIGTHKPFYDVWGDTVNLAARLETNAKPNHIQVSDSTRQLLTDRFSFQKRGRVTLKGKGKVEIWYLIDRIT
nr:adenylate/guanylate cyclase domain-containing protein [Amylibacter ulvae]